MRLSRFTSSVLRPTAGVVVAIWLAYRAWCGATTPACAHLPTAGLQQVARVIDGDTLLMADGSRMRLQGVNTPETKHPTRGAETWGEEAAQFSREQLEGKMVDVAYDRERFDHFGRVLAFVSIDGRLHNEELIRQGYSKAETFFAYSEASKRRFRAAEKDARDNRRGIWSEAGTVSP